MNNWLKLLKNPILSAVSNFIMLQIYLVLGYEIKIIFPSGIDFYKSRCYNTFKEDELRRLIYENK